MTRAAEDDSELGERLLRQAAELAFPRYPGTEGDARAIALVEARLREPGLATSVEEFSYDIRPALWTLRGMLLWGAAVVATVGLVVRASPLAAAVLLALALLPGVVFLAWSPSLERLYRRPGPTRTANVVGHRPAVDPRWTLIVMAHHDSKSQSLTLPTRVACTVLAISGALVLAVLVAMAAVTGRVPGPSWLAPALGFAAGLAAAVLSTMRSGNRSPGGVDNAGSVAILLELARSLPERLPDDVELHFLSTGAEEDHMVGAMRWLDRHGTELRSRPAYCLNFDGAGAPGRLVLLERYGFGRLFSPAMSTVARRAADRLGVRLRGVLQPPGLGIDAIPFAHRGVPCLTISSGALGRATLSIHSVDDRAEHLDADMLAAATTLAAEVAIELDRIQAGSHGG